MNRLADETSPYLLQHARGIACDAVRRGDAAEASLVMPSRGHGGFAAVAVAFAGIAAGGVLQQ